MYRSQLRWGPVAILILLALTWGANMASVKIGERALAPLFMAGLRSAVASFCLYIWMKAKGIPVFPSRGIFIHGMAVGLLFGTEFGFLYQGLKYTLASRAYVLLYTAPFFVAVGAHFFLKDDRLHLWKVAGLVLAFSGVVTLFLGDLGSFSWQALPGDLMALTAAALWASTTIYLKKYLSLSTVALQTLFYQVFFSAPPLLLMSLVIENPIISGLNLSTGFAVFYQCIIIAFLSYLVWFELIHRYPVSLLHAFSFFTPVFGVFLSGALILGEPISPSVMVSLGLVSLGMILVNRQPGPPVGRPAVEKTAGRSAQDQGQYT
jgi:drug/metabolite transporter (DMT)-like permease